MTEVRPRRKVRTGTVVSDKMDKTVVVAVERQVHHRLYGKAIRLVTKFKVHDETNQYHVGDVVSIVETRPLSATKRWRVLSIVTKGQVPDVSPDKAVEPAVAEVTTHEEAQPADKQQEEGE